MTIIDIRCINECIECSYGFRFATRMQHLQAPTAFLLPEKIINSYLFRFFSLKERNFLEICDGLNDVLAFAKNNPYHKVYKAYICTNDIFILKISVNHIPDENYIFCEIKAFSAFTQILKARKFHKDICILLKPIIPNFDLY